MSVTHPQGFRASGVTAGLKPSGRPDVALVVNDGPADVAAAVYTSNRCKANPVLWSEQVTRGKAVRAVLLNSGGANCYTGPQGFQATHTSAEQVAELLGCDAGEVVICSTGLIGQQLNFPALQRGTAAAASGLSTSGGADAAEAIMTTDTRPKQVVVSGEGWSIGGMAKGAGMLAPALATMLVVLTTDADLTPEQADEALRAATSRSFDRLDSDGCQSTNDTVVLMASAASTVKPDLPQFISALTEACVMLAKELMNDAEGADHDITIRTRGAATVEDALEVGHAVARNSLFKAAVFGKDPNWGRILAAVGTTAAAFDPADLDVSINGVLVCRNSGPDADPALVDLEPREVLVEIDLKSGRHEADIWTNDLTHAYVHENSAYST